MSRVCYDICDICEEKINPGDRIYQLTTDGRVGNKIDVCGACWDALRVAIKEARKNEGGQKNK